MSQPSRSKESSLPSPVTPRTIPLSAIQDAVLSIRHGSVQIIIQDSVVVQIDKTEKLRLR